MTYTTALVTDIRLSDPDDLMSQYIIQLESGAPPGVIVILSVSVSFDTVSTAIEGGEAPPVSVLIGRSAHGALVFITFDVQNTYVDAPLADELEFVCAALISTLRGICTVG